jgi:alpha-tubulin suppressor-like RCC1 family protein
MGDTLPTVDLGTGEAAVGIVAGSIHTCARLTGGRLKCWGFNGYGQLGLNHTQNIGDGPNEMGNALPLVDLGTGKLAADVVAGGYHACALLTDSSVKCWGRNNYGQLGLGDTLSRGDTPNEMGNNLPALNLGTGKTAAMITAGAEHACARLNDGSAKCWGYNLEGQLGQGHTSPMGDWWSEVGNGLVTTKLFSAAW